MGERTCKRCSVIRVNTLYDAYKKAHADNNPKALHGLREIAAIVKSRGYDEALRLEKPGLADQQLRAFCWNVSSFLEDDEIKQIFGWMAKTQSAND